MITYFVEAKHANKDECEGYNTPSITYTQIYLICNTINSYY